MTNLHDARVEAAVDEYLKLHLDEAGRPSIRESMRAAIAAADAVVTVERAARYENVSTAHVAAGQIIARPLAKEVSARQLIDAIFDADEDDVNDSVRFGFILEQFELLRVIYSDGEVAVDD